jgi:hypothetical protein
VRKSKVKVIYLSGQHITVRVFIVGKDSICDLMEYRIYCYCDCDSQLLLF